MIDIYRSSTIITSVHPEDGDKVTKKVMGENTLKLTVKRSSPFDFHIGDYLFFSGERYTLNITPKVKKDAQNRFVYDLLLEGIEYELRKVQHLFYTANIAYVGGSDFSLMGDAALQARIIVENLNRVQSGWTVGSVISSDVKNLTFSNNSCLEAITKIAQEFDTEYWIGSNKTINIGKRGDIHAVTFEYGKNKGLYSIERSNVNSKDIITRLYPFGSQSNLPKGYRSNAKRLQISTSYIERNVASYGVIESSEIFEDIKPERTGTITSVGDIFTFVDTSMDFDLNATSGGSTLYLIPGTTAKIHFQTGDLAGYDFELSSYVHATTTFKINKFTNEVAYDLPNSTLKPRIGDKYIITDIYMPQSYVDAAEVKLLAKAQESLNQNSEPNVSYRVVIDPLFIKNLGFTFKAGDYVSVVDSQLVIDRDIRIVTIDRNLNRPDHYDFDLADTVEPSLTSQIVTTLEAQDIIIQMNRLLDPARARRSWKTTEELKGAIYDQDGYFDPTNIKPFSIETNMLTVGSKGTQFYINCYFQPNSGGNKNSIVVGNGSLAHLTIEDSIRTWAITGLTETVPDDNLRYIFIKCLKAGNTGQVILSATQLAIDDGTYYNFFAGVLSSVIDNARQVSLLFGFTSVNGRFIKTGRIVSGAGTDRYIDIDTGEIQGVFKFTSGDSVETSVSTAQTTANNAQSTANAKNKHFTGQPTTPYIVGDTWSNGVSLYRCNVARASGAYVAGDWGVAVTYDNTSTIISGGLVTSGTIQLGSGDGSATYIKAGITGQGDPDTSVRIWAGGTFAYRDTANFRVQQNGRVVSRSSYDLEDVNGNVLAGLVGGGSGVTLRFWAGGTQGNEATNPFRVYSDGSCVFQKATLQSGTSGQRIVVSSADGTLSMYNPDGNQSVVLGSTGGGYPYLNMALGTSACLLDINGVNATQSLASGYCKVGTMGVYNANGANWFKVDCTSRLDVLLYGLPTSASGLASNQLYASGGYVRIVP